MKQVTGSNAPATVNKVSIQHTLDGHSFSLPSFDGACSCPMEIELLTPKTVLVPRPLFDPTCAAQLLAAAGLPLRTTEKAVWSDASADCVAVMALDVQIARQIDEKLGERAYYTSPLLYTPASAQASVWLYRADDVLYIKVYGDSLQFAEAFPAMEQTDLIYLMERFAKVFPLAAYTLVVGGENPQELRKMIGKRFKKVVCE